MSGSSAPASAPGSFDEERISVLIVDDHPVVRAGLVGMLAGEADLTVVGEAASADEAVTVAATRQPDVVLMDLRMPGGDGVQATTGVLAAAPGARVKVLRLVAKGLSNPEIGRHLSISEATVKTHLLRAFAKLGVSDRTAAVTTALAAGYHL